jgi:hypothetical protein
MRYYLTFLLLLATFYLFAQEKVEIERPFPVNQVPNVAKDYVCELFPNAKGKWIMERSNLGDKLEVKLKVNKRRISIEFNRKGAFEDVEEQVLVSDLEKAVALKIKSKLSDDFDRYRIKKIQHHYSGDKEEILNFYKTGEANFRFISQLFEMVVYGIKDKEIHSFEYTFSLDGDFVERLMNAEQNTDNLLF